MSKTPESMRSVDSTNIQPRDTETNRQFARFFEIVRILRSPAGCPWDREQTPETLKGFLLEEAFECIDAISRGDHDHVAEELGDVFLIAAMIAYVYEQDGLFSVERVFGEIGDKLIRRHPHVFGDSTAADSVAVKRQWDEIKTRVEGKSGRKSLLDKVSRGFSPLEASFRLQRKAAKVGFDWPDYQPVVEKLHEEIAELKQELRSGEISAGPADVEGEIGDLLFTAVNLARKVGVDPTLALHRSNEKFRRRFAHIEYEMEAEGRDMSPREVHAMERLWNAAKLANKDSETE